MFFLKNKRSTQKNADIYLNYETVGKYFICN